MWVTGLLVCSAGVCFALGLRAGGAALLVWASVRLLRFVWPAAHRAPKAPSETQTFIFALACAFLVGLFDGLFKGARQLQQDFLRRNPRWWE